MQACHPRGCRGCHAGGAILGAMPWHPRISTDELTRLTLSQPVRWGQIMPTGFQISDMYVLKPNYFKRRSSLLMTKNFDSKNNLALSSFALSKMWISNFEYFQQDFKGDKQN